MIACSSRLGLPIPREHPPEIVIRPPTSSVRLLCAASCTCTCCLQNTCASATCPATGAARWSWEGGMNAGSACKASADRRCTAGHGAPCPREAALGIFQSPTSECERSIGTHQPSVASVQAAPSLSPSLGSAPGSTAPRKPHRNEPGDSCVKGRWVSTTHGSGASALISRARVTCVRCSWAVDAKLNAASQLRVCRRAHCRRCVLERPTARRVGGGVQGAWKLQRQTPARTRHPVW